eukprot:COSAG01_NODE_13174_length_1625_cov_1.295544_1_plen_25_part_10
MNFHVDVHIPQLFTLNKLQKMASAL